MFVKLMLTKEDKVTIVDSDNKELLTTLFPLFNPYTNREIGLILKEQAITFIVANIKERHIDSNSLFIDDIKYKIKLLKQAQKVFKHTSNYNRKFYY